MDWGADVRADARRGAFWRDDGGNAKRPLYEGDPLSEGGRLSGVFSPFGQRGGHSVQKILAGDRFSEKDGLLY